MIELFICYQSGDGNELILTAIFTARKIASTQRTSMDKSWQKLKERARLLTSDNSQLIADHSLLVLIGGSLSPYFKISHGNSNPRIRRGTNRCG